MTSTAKSHIDDDKAGESLSFLEPSNFVGESLPPAVAHDADVDDDDGNDGEADDNDVVPKPATTLIETPPSLTPYKSRKPKWWKNLGQGRPSKGQKKAMAALQSTHQLPRIPYGDVYEWDKVFAGQKEEVNNNGNDNDVVDQPSFSLSPWLEIGSGTGENLLAMAEKHPQQRLIGAEMHPSGIGKCFQRVHQSTLRQRFWRGYSSWYSMELERECQTNLDSERNPYVVSEKIRSKQSEDYNDESMYSSRDSTCPLSTSASTSNLTANGGGPYPHVRLFPGNGVTVLQKSPTASLGVVLVTFPDPFPSQSEYRLLQDDVVQEIHRVLEPGVGRLVVATDHDGHAAWVQNQMIMTREGDRPQQETQLWSGICAWKQIEATAELRSFYLPVVSKYEAKGWHEGRTTKLLIYERLATNH